jgi:hypothetical protein
LIMQPNMSRIIDLHRRFHGQPVACAVRRYRAEIAEREERSITAADPQHERDVEPSGDQGQRSRILA